MSERPSLVKQLAGSYTGTQPVVYLPQRSRDGEGTTPAASENYANRPDVIAAQEAYLENPDRFHGASVPQNTILTEKPIHRMMIYVHAKGASVKEIAEQFGYTPAAVTNILRQPWAQSRLVQILKECGLDEVKHFLKTEVSPSLAVLKDIRDGNGGAKASDRLAASKEILDRALGKSTIHVEAKNTNTNLPADMARLDAELASLRKQVGDVLPGAS